MRALVLLGVLGWGCSADGTGGGSPRPAPDEHGVRVAGGETSDFGNGSGPCQFHETPEIGLEEALATGWPVAAALEFFDQRFETPFHWGSRCDEDPTATVTGMPTIAIEVEPLAVRRRVATPFPDQPESACNDLLVYRAVVDLETDDGRVAGRFYASFLFVDEGSASFANSGQIRADLRNFSGSLTAPFDLGRPHWSAMIMSFILRDDGMGGSLNLVVNYTDDDEAHQGYAPGFWPADAQPSDNTYSGMQCTGEPAPPPPGSRLLALDAYRGSVVPPTCLVEASFFGQGQYEDVTAEAYDPNQPPSWSAVDVSLSVDGMPIALPASWEIPFDLGRLPEGTVISLDVSSKTPAAMPFAALTVDRDDLRGNRYNQFAFCQPVGCVAHVEETVKGYCAR